MSNLDIPTHDHATLPCYMASCLLLEKVSNAPSCGLIVASKDDTPLSSPLGLLLTHDVFVEIDIHGL